MPNTLFLLVKIGGCIIATLLYITNVQARPYVPTNPQTILETLPQGSLRYTEPTNKPINNNGIAGVKKAAALADFAVVKPQIDNLLLLAYNQGDPRALGQAESLLKPYIATTVINSPQSAQTALAIQLTWAAILQASHQFNAANSVLTTLLQRHAIQPEALLMLASLELVHGNFVSAQQHCNALKDLSVLVLKLACSAQIESMTGKLTKSHATLKTLYGMGSGLTAAQQQWVSLIWADAAMRLSDSVTYTTLFAKPMPANAVSAPVLVAQADWLLANKQWQAAYNVLTLPQYKPLVLTNDSLLLKLVTAELALQAPQAETHYSLLAARIKQWRVRGDNSHQREEAQFALLRQPAATALQLARSNWVNQRETADVVVYADAAIRANSRKDIVLIQQWIKQVGYQYPALSQRLTLAK